jgi:isopentenyldiphosphate isomerase
LDVVDEHGEPTGERLEKWEVHERGLPHRDVHVFITNGTHLLEQQRSPTKNIMPGTWDISAAGHVGAGEGYLETAVRETKEELGLSFAPERFRALGRLAARMTMGTSEQPWIHHTVGENYVVYAPEVRLEDVTVQESEVIGVRWYPIDQLEADVEDPVTAERHAPQPIELWRLGIAGMRAAAREGAITVDPTIVEPTE